MTGCPADDDLVRLVEGALGDASLGALEEHVAGCERCAAVMGELGAAGGASPRRTLAGYQLDRRIASGGMGEVWAAWDAELQREVAIKLVRPEHAEDPRQRARLLREARALAKLAHPNVLAVYDVGEAGGEVYVATELVAGDTLASRGGPSADWRGVARLYVQAARGLAAAHAVGLVHRDVKPANLLVGADGRVRVADFGLAIGGGDAAVPATDGAAALAATFTAAGAIAGTPAYMAPEQRSGGAVDARCDQYALAVALVEGIDGRRPSAGIAAAALRELIAERRPREAALDALADVLARALAVAADARFASMDALADALDGSLAPPAAVPAPAPPRRRGLVLPALAALAAAGIAIAALATTHADPASPSIAVTQPLPVPAAVTAPVTVTAPVAAPAPVAMTADRKPQPPPRPQPLPPPAPPPHHASLDDVALALRHRDAAACARAVASLGPSLPADRVELSRIHCAMLAAADCTDATTRLAALYKASSAPATLAQADADLYCPPTDPATRARRLTAQLLHFRPDPAACPGYVAAARALAAEATDDRARMVAATVLGSLASCFSEARRCDEARALLHEAGALVPAVDTPAELTSACR